MNPSDMRELVMDLPSPLPLSRLGVEGEYVVGLERSLDVLDLRERVFSPESGLGGKLLHRLSPRGGCGKELMLTVFRSVLPAALVGWKPLC